MKLSAVAIVCALAALAGCSKQGHGLSAASGSSASLAATAGMAPIQQSGRVRSLAYEHSVSIEIRKELLAQRLRELEAACNEDRTSGCTILDVSLHSQRQLPSGSIRMRLAPSGVEPTIALASRDGEVVGRNTRAEDLAEPVADTERQLALLTMHRDRLAELMRSKDIKFEQLLAVSKELATVQAEIDSLGSRRANLQRRIDTELLTINLSLPMGVFESNQSPVLDALRGFGSDFRSAVAMVIRFLAVLVPWLVIILPALFLLRLFWGWIGRRIAGRA